MLDTEKAPPVSTDLNPAHPEGQTAMQDETLVERLEENPEDPDAQLDAALDASMDGSDPVSIAQPARAAEPAPVGGQHGQEAGRATADPHIGAASARQTVRRI